MKPWTEVVKFISYTINLRGGVISNKIKNKNKNTGQELRTRTMIKNKKTKDKK